MAKLEEERAPEESRRGGIKRWALLGGAVLVVVVGLVFWLLHRGRESTDDAQIDGHIVPLSARVGGTVQAVHVQDNQYVTAGTVLVEIDPTDYKVALQHAEGELAAAVASAGALRTSVPVASTTSSGQVRTAQSDVQSANARVRTAQAHVSEAEAKLAKASTDLARLDKLVEKDEISRQEYDAAKEAAASARAERDAAVAQAHEAEAGVTGAHARLSEASTAPEQVSIARSRASEAEAKVQQARAAVERARLDLEHATVKAPSSGVVSKKSVEVGQVVQVGQPLLAVVPLEDIWVTANFKEVQLKDIRPGQQVEVKVDAYGRSYRARVDSIAAATGAKFSLLPPENATGNFVKVVQRVPVKIVFEKGQDPDHLLRPGMSVVPIVHTK